MSNVDPSGIKQAIITLLNSKNLDNLHHSYETLISILTTRPEQF